jgi:hypothetical protein
MNAAERLWRAVEERDWQTAIAQFDEQALIEWPHTGERLTPADYVAAHRGRPSGRAVHVLRVVTDGELVAVEATVGEARCAGFYDLHQARINAATEYWIGDGRRSG